MASWHCQLFFFVVVCLYIFIVNFLSGMCCDWLCELQTTTDSFEDTAIIADVDSCLYCCNVIAVPVFVFLINVNIILLINIRYTRLHLILFFFMLHLPWTY